MGSNFPQRRFRESFVFRWLSYESPIGGFLANSISTRPATRFIIAMIIGLIRSCPLILGGFLHVVDHEGLDRRFGKFHFEAEQDILSESRERNPLPACIYFMSLLQSP